MKPLGQAARREKRRGRVEGQKSPKIEKMAILSGKLAILGHFSRFSPDNHLDICFSDQQDFTESTLVFYILKYLDFMAEYPENRENGHNMYQNGHIWYFLAILLLEPFDLYVSVLNVKGMHIFYPSEKIAKVLVPKITKN